MKTTSAIRPLLTCLAGLLVSPLLLMPVAPPADAATPRPNARIVNWPGKGPQVTRWHLTPHRGPTGVIEPSPVAPWMVRYRVDLVFDPRTTTGCQVDTRLLRSNNGMRSWTPYTEWKPFRDFDGSIVAQRDAVIPPGDQWLRIQSQMTCMPLNSTVPPWRHPLTGWMPLHVLAPPAPNDGRVGAGTGPSDPALCAATRLPVYCAPKPPLA